jgi:ribokinase
MAIAVFGSINMDLVVRSTRLPTPGETLIGDTFQTIPGGKGANQAVACARLGAATYMVGRVGDDVFGSTLKQELEDAGVDQNFVEIGAGVSSGIALIAVEDSGENIIIVIPGANGQVGVRDIKRLEVVLEKTKILLLQLEIPINSVTQAAKIAKDKGITVILDPAPARTLTEEIYRSIDILTPNESEAASLVGFRVDSLENAHKAAVILHKRGVPQVIIKMGSVGAYTINNGHEKYYEAFPVIPVDTVAAGDAFNGALAVALNEDYGLNEAVIWGLAAGALSVTKEGAQPSLPTRKELLELIDVLRNE